MRKIKRICTVILIALLILSSTGCSGCAMGAVIAYQGQRPFDYPPAKWVSEDPDIWFVTRAPGDPLPAGVTNSWVQIGQLRINGETIDIVVGFDGGHGIDVDARTQTSTNNVLFLGSCKFSPDKLTVSIYKNYDNIFNGQYKTIVFNRIPLDDSGTNIITST